MSNLTPTQKDVIEILDGRISIKEKILELIGTHYANISEHDRVYIRLGKMGSESVVFEDETIFADLIQKTRISLLNQIKEIEELKKQIKK